MVPSRVGTETLLSFLAPWSSLSRGQISGGKIDYWDNNTIEWKVHQSKSASPEAEPPWASQFTSLDFSILNKDKETVFTQKLFISKHLEFWVEIGDSIGCLSYYFSWRNIFILLKLYSSFGYCAVGARKQRSLGTLLYFPGRSSHRGFYSFALPAIKQK